MPSTEAKALAKRLMQEFRSANTEIQDYSRQQRTGDAFARELTLIEEIEHLCEKALAEGRFNLGSGFYQSPEKSNIGQDSDFDAIAKFAAKQQLETIEKDRRNEARADALPSAETPYGANLRKPYAQIVAEYDLAEVHREAAAKVRREELMEMHKEAAEWADKQSPWMPEKSNVGQVEAALNPTAKGISPFGWNGTPVTLDEAHSKNSVNFVDKFAFREAARWLERNQVEQAPTKDQYERALREQATTATDYAWKHKIIECTPGMCVCGLPVKEHGK